MIRITTIRFALAALAPLAYNLSICYGAVFLRSMSVDASSETPPKSPWLRLWRRAMSATSDNAGD